MSDRDQDERVERLFRESAVYGAADRLLRLAEAAWRTSATRRRMIGGSDRIHVAAGVAVTASLVALVLAPLGTTPRPLFWLVPALAGGVAAGVLLIAPRASR